MTRTTRDELGSRLKPYQQEHLLQFWDELTFDEQQRLAAQIMQIDFDLLQRLVHDDRGHDDWRSMAGRAQPPAAFRLGQTDDAFSREQADQAAEQLLREGRVGAVLVAGGQGTRLGFPYPKGMFQIGPVSDRTLFQMHVDQLRAVAARYETRIPLFLMTSPATHAETVLFFQRHDRFGLAEDDLHIFCQGTMPAVDANGRLLMASKGELFLSPDGHGGMLMALDRSGGLTQAQEMGLEQLFYFQVDNPMVSVCDREQIGFHVLSDSDMSTLVVAKQNPSDKVGNVVSVDGRLMVIEYSDLPLEAAERRDSHGELTLWAGSIAVHVFRVDFLARAAASRESLPFHMAKKKVPFVNHDGVTVSPDEPNATKFEKFVFDLMPAANNAIVVEGDECEIFAPLKNASGEAKDTPETTRAALVDKFARWLRAAGAKLEGEPTVEISPDVALDVAELHSKIEPGMTIDQDTYLQ